MTFEPIAIVGAGCVLPDCLSPSAVWNAVREQRILYGAPPAGRWSLPLENMLETQHAGNYVPDKCWSVTGGYVRGFENVFLPHRFESQGVPLEQLDPVFLWSLHAAQEAFSNVRTSSQHIPANRRGLILGNLSYPSSHFAQLVHEHWFGKLFPHFPRETHPLNRFMSGLPAMLTAKLLGFSGKAYCLDAACASTLYALHNAARALQRHECDLMLAGGVSATDPATTHVGFCALSAMSRTDRCRPFLADADGLIPSEGAAVFALKRLSDAQKAGDTILAVIRGTGLSNDGRGSGLLAPAESGQVRCLETAYAASGIDPSTVQFVECHGTGTPVGDATELRTLQRIFKNNPALPIGSAKANFGHLMTAAGGVGLLKLIGAFNAQELPPAPESNPLSEAVRSSGLCLVTEPEPWTENANGLPRRAAINAFGFGGNNAHLILDEAPSDAQTKPSSKRSKGKTVAKKVTSSTDPSSQQASVKAKNQPAIAIVSIGFKSRHCQNFEQFQKQLFADNLPQAMRARTADHFELPLPGLAFPPVDLQAALSQQTLLLAATHEALENVKSTFPAERSGAFIGMSTDPDAARHSARWRLSSEWKKFAPESLDSDKLKALQDALHPPAQASHVIGTMPNMPANRLSFQHRLQQSTYTVSAEELSGDYALQEAIESLQSGQLDAAIVGASDLSNHPIHRQALIAMGGDGACPQEDLAVVIVLRRLDDARSAGESVLAVICSDSEVFEIGAVSSDVSPLRELAEEIPNFGKNHTAQGLLRIAAATAMLGHRRWWEPKNRRWEPVLSNRETYCLRVKNASLFGGAAAWRMSIGCSDHKLYESVSLAKPSLWAYAANSREALIEQALSGAPCAKEHGTWRLACWGLPDELQSIAAHAARALQSGDWAEGNVREQAIYRSQAVEGELAFTYTGAASAYAGMGRDLALAFPELLDKATTVSTCADHWCSQGFRGEAHPVETPFSQLCASAFGCQIHALFSQNILGLSPDAVIGLSSGETNALIAHRIWRDMDAMLEEIVACRLYEDALGGKFESVREYLKIAQNQPILWENWILQGKRSDIEAAVAEEPEVFLAIVQTPEECVIGGLPEACARVRKKLEHSGAKSLPLGHKLVVHAPAALPFEPTWRKLHTRRVYPANGSFRLYANAFGDSYTPDIKKAAEALTRQAMQTVDFPALIEKAYAEGVRIFLEHGPRQHLSLAVSKILGNRPHLSIPLDKFGRSSALQGLEAAAQLWTAGRQLATDRLMPVTAEKPPPETSTPSIKLAFSMPDFAPQTLSAAPVEIPAATELSGTRIMRPPPENPYSPEHYGRPPQAIGTCQPHAPTQIHSTSHPLAAAFAATTERHRQYIENMRLAEAQLQQTLAAIRNTALGWTPVATPSAAPAPEYTSIQQPPTTSNDKRRFDHPGLTRAQLLAHAGGALAEAFGAEFAEIDTYPQRVHVPLGDLLLTDRVIGFQGMPRSMSTGKVWTETLVHSEAWYMHANHMGLGPFIESGQCDMLLMSWLGIDFHNQGKRVYRLLQATITLTDSLPEAGDLLEYEISVDRHLAQGDVRMIEFSNVCRINGDVRLITQNGLAGFFTPEELDNSEGGHWNPAQMPPPSAPPPQVPAQATERQSFDCAAVQAYQAGDMTTAFGHSHRLSLTHTRSPRTRGGREDLIGCVPEVDFSGGPHGRGYARTLLELKPDHWFYPIHFKNDPCMPGTLMVEGGVQAMAFYMTALGCTLDKDGWRFEPAPNRPYELICRSQAIPSSKELSFELFIQEFEPKPLPTLVAHILCTVDGKQAFICKNFALRLVPDFPLLEQKHLLLADEADTRPVARIDGHPCDKVSLLHSAYGKQSGAFGPRFLQYDKSILGLPRLPMPPLLMIHRMLSVSDEPSQMKIGASVRAAFDIEPDAWYFQENSRPTMPHGAFMELILQPCGWLAAYQLSPRLTAAGLTVRNLDGALRMFREITPLDRSVETVCTLTSISEVGGLVIESFRNQSYVGDELVAEIDTCFGFFPQEALVNQKGLKVLPEDQTRLNTPDNFSEDLSLLPAHYFGGTARLPRGKWRFLDRLTCWQPTGGKRGKGYLRGERDIRCSDWVFKAHFFQDPVQPGSIGVESLVQLLQAYLLLTHRDKAFTQPVFEPIRIHEMTEWHYRGQVTPVRDLITLELEVTEEGQDEHGYYAEAEGYLWTGGLKIYHVARMGMRLIENANAPVSARLKETSPFIASNITQAWLDKTGRERSLLTDLCEGLTELFVDTVHFEDQDDFQAVRHQPALFLANHQVGIETALFAWIMGALTHAPLVSIAKQELATGWAGVLAEMSRYALGENGPGRVAFFEREQQTSLLQLIANINFSRESLFLHVAGTRSTHAGEPVVRMSSVFADLALKHDLTIIPVRFSGALPNPPEPSLKREYPYRAGMVTIWIGRSIRAHSLKDKALKDRNALILDSLNHLGPPLEAESPHPARPEIQATLDALEAQGITPFLAACLAGLQNLKNPTPASRALLNAWEQATPKALQQAAHKYPEILPLTRLLSSI